MRTRTATIVALLALAAAIAGCASWQAPPTPRALPILDQVHTQDPGLTEPAVFVASSRQDLITRGSEQLIDLAMETIDFDEHSLLVVALGQRPSGGYWAHIDAVQTDGRTLYVQGRVNAPGSDEMTTQALTFPVAAAIVPRTEATMVLDEIDSVVGQPAP